MIRMIVGRCHISQTNKQVIQYVISRLKRKYKTFVGMAKAERKDFMRQIIACHQENIAEYHAVMG